MAVGVGKAGIADTVAPLLPHWLSSPLSFQGIRTYFILMLFRSVYFHFVKSELFGFRWLDLKFFLHGSCVRVCARARVGIESLLASLINRSSFAYSCHSAVLAAGLTLASWGSPLPLMSEILPIWSVDPGRCVPSCDQLLGKCVCPLIPSGGSCFLPVWTEVECAACSSFPMNAAPWPSTAFLGKGFWNLDSFLSPFRYWI